MIDDGVFRLKSAITCIRCVCIDAGSEIWQYGVPSSYMYRCLKRKYLLSREEPLQRGLLLKANSGSYSCVSHFLRLYMKCLLC